MKRHWIYIVLIVSGYSQMLFGQGLTKPADSLGLVQTEEVQKTESSMNTLSIEARRDSARAWYDRGKYSQSAQAWQSIADTGMVSAELFYNLGNAYFKAGEIPQAILYYERSLLLNPGDEDTEFNLQVARSRILDRIEAIPPFFLKRWMKSIQDLFSSDGWAIISITSFLLMLLLASLFLYSRRLGLRRSGFWLGILMLFVSVASFGFSRSQKEEITQNPYAIVFSPSVTALSEPNAGSAELFVIHEGLKVKMLDQKGDWQEIRLSDGKTGWVKTGDLEQLAF